jgi:hypothetical protein
VIAQTGTDEDLRDSVIACFEPWQPIIGCYYAVKLSGPSPGIRPVWSLLCVKTVKDGVVELDMLFEPFGCYRDMPLSHWLWMCWSGDQIMPMAEAVKRGLITDEAVASLTARRATHEVIVKLSNDAGHWIVSPSGIVWEDNQQLVVN